MGQEVMDDNECVIAVLEQMGEHRLVVDCVEVNCLFAPVVVVCLDNYYQEGLEIWQIQPLSAWLACETAKREKDGGFIAPV